MKLIITGDWQLDAHPAMDRLKPNGASTRFEENVDAIRGLLRAGLDAGADGLLHLGDLTEHKNPGALELEAAGILFDQVLSAGRRIWAIAGNHDGAFFDVSGSSFKPLAAMRSDAMKVFHKVDFVPEMRMLAVPYIHRASPAAIADAVDALEWIPPFTGFAAVHYGLMGCLVGARNTVLPGDYLGPEQLKMEMDHVFAGHIHKAQQLQFGMAKGWHPGSPVICDMGEREDRKTWLLFDTVTREVQVRDVPQPRRWISIDYSSLPDDPTGTPAWSAEDLVAIRGTCAKGEYPKAEIEALVRGGWPQPFALEVQVKAERAERASRDLAISTEGGLRQALQEYVRERYHRTGQVPGQVGPATAQALEVLREQGAMSLCSEVRPMRVEIENFMTFGAAKVNLPGESPTLITGENGVGKTNFMEALLWAISGQTSKGLSLAGVVRQGESEARVSLTMIGFTPEQEDQVFKIVRSVKLSKAGKPSQKLELLREKLVAGTDGWENLLSDGNLADVQARIDGLVGGSYLTMRTTAFKIQRDKSPFIESAPADRKAIIGEITGLAPLGRAFRLLDTKRQDSQRAHLSASERLLALADAATNAEAQLLTVDTEMAQASEDLTSKRAFLPSMMERQTALKEQHAALVEEGSRIAKEVSALPATADRVAQASKALELLAQEFGRLELAAKEEGRQVAERIATSEAAMSELNVPAPQTVEDQRVKAQTLRAAVGPLRDRCTKLGTELATVASEKTSADSAMWRTDSELKSVNTMIGALPADQADPDLDALDAVKCEAVQTAEAASRIWAEGKAEVQAREQGVSSLKAKLESFNGQDVGKCSRCGQAINSTHLEQELAAIRAELVVEESRLAGAREILVGLHAAMLKANEENNRAQTAYAEGLRLESALRSARDRRRMLEDRAAELTITMNKASEAVQALAERSDLLVAQAKAATVEHELMEGQAVSAEYDLGISVTAQTRHAGLVALLGELRGRLLEWTNAMPVREAGFKARETVLRGELVAAEAFHNATAERFAALKVQVDRNVAFRDQTQADAADQAVAIAKFESEIQALQTKIGQCMKDRERLNAQVKQVADQKIETAMLAERAEIDAMAANLLDPKQGLPIYLIDQALPFLEDRINHYLAKLGMEKLTVELTTLDGDKETLAILIDNGRPGPRLDIAAFSGGQLDRVEYGVKCALADLARQTRGVTLGLVCFDEPSGGLNAAGKAALLDLIFERHATYPVTIVTSHDEELRAAFTQRLHFEAGPTEETVVREAA